MDQQDTTNPGALVPDNAINEAMELLWGLVSALHALADPVVATPIPETTSEESGAIPPLLLEPTPSMSSLRRPYDERPPTPTAESSEEEGEGVIGGAIPRLEDGGSEEGGELFTFGDTSSYFSQTSLPSPPQCPGFSSQKQPLELRWDALERALRVARESIISARS